MQRPTSGRFHLSTRSNPNEQTTPQAIEGGETKDNNRVRVPAMTGKFGDTFASNPVTKFELKFNTTTCLLSLEDLQIPLSMKIAENTDGVDLTEAEMAQTVAHEKIHLDAFLSHQEKLETLANTFVNVFNGLPQPKRSELGGTATLLLNSNAKGYLKQLAATEGVRQIAHLDHLAGNTRGVEGGMVVVNSSTYEDRLDKPAFIADINTRYSKSFTTFDEATDYLSDRITYWNTKLDNLFTVVTARINQ